MGTAERGPGGGPGRSPHLPVLPVEVVEAFGETLDGWVVDATLGAGGHASLLLETFPGLSLLGVDQDPHILAHARARLAGYGDRVRVRRGRMSSLRSIIEEEAIPRVVGVLADLGASSLQFDDAARGFSFSDDGPLDMRMDPDRTRTAADIVNRWDEGDLADLFYYEGGERASRRIAAAIVEARRRVPFLRTGALADLVQRTIGRSGRIHPATRTFQALRRAVNEEADELSALLSTAEEWLVDGGRVVVISFHSGEDGAVKRFLASGAREGRWSLLTKKPVQASPVEVRANARARSAALRAAVRTRRPARGPVTGGRTGGPA